MKISKAMEVLQAIHETAGDEAQVKVFEDADTPRKTVTGARIEWQPNGEPVVLIHVFKKKGA